MRKFRKKYWLSILLLLFIAISFLFGPFFPWSPVKPGYEAVKYKTYTLYTPVGVTVPEFYKTLDGELALMSDTLDLPIKRDIKIIRTDKAAFQGYVPWLKTGSLGGVSLMTGNVVYVSYEKIKDQNLDELEYTKHELIHILHHQNTTLGNALRSSSIHYLSEGVPFYLAGPNFFSKEELINKVLPLDLKETTERDEIYTSETFDSLDEKTAERYKVSHMLYGEFVNYLIATYGEEKFNAFNKAVLEKPSEHRALFEKHFGVKLENALQVFEKQFKESAPAKSGS